MNLMKRMRGRHSRGGGPIRHHSSGSGIPLNRNHVFDSSGPDMRMRGTAQQLFEKYLQLGRDATASGDRVMAESYFQHAEHYFRILNAMSQAAAQQQQQQAQQAGQRAARQRDSEAGEEEGAGEPAGSGMGAQPEIRDVEAAASEP